tara:strand:- start:651 stop:1280 length:630 start_codon:yes stop_codon:yes gene_type:complete
MTPVILFSLTVHEYSHGKMAYLLGDDTASRLGRLSFNPLRHLDPFGVLFFYFMGFGWAKPVPVDWRNFLNPRKDMMYVSLAGPFSNIVLAVFCSFFVRVIEPSQIPWIFYMLCFGVYINVALAVFNMLPVFPLDGSSIIKGMVSHKIAERMTSFDRVGGFVILAVFLMDHFLDTRILGYVIGVPVMKIVEILTQEMFPLLQQLLWASFG